MISSSTLLSKKVHWGVGEHLHFFIKKFEDFFFSFSLSHVILVCIFRLEAVRSSFQSLYKS